MGNETQSKETYTRSVRSHVRGPGPVTRAAEQKARTTGKLHPLVDPAGYDVIRESRMRMEELDNGLWRVTVGLPIPKETRVDTTGSMGDNVDVAMRVLPSDHELCIQMLSSCDLHVATGIFGDVGDNFVLCRPQFEMTSGKIVQQLTLMVPERAGGDVTEDPHYGIFGGAFLTRTYAGRIGLKGYDFTVTDAPTRDRFNVSTLRRVFGPDVLEMAKKNGHDFSGGLPGLREVVQSHLLKRAHAFVLLLEKGEANRRHWEEYYGSNRVVSLPDTNFLPHVQAVIIGLTEGTLDLTEVEAFLQRNGMSLDNARCVTRSVANIPIGAQCALEAYDRRPMAGALFRGKPNIWTDEYLWPMTPEEVEAYLAERGETPDANNDEESGAVSWL